MLQVKQCYQKLRHSPRVPLEATRAKVTFSFYPTFGDASISIHKSTDHTNILPNKIATTPFLRIQEQMFLADKIIISPSITNFINGFCSCCDACAKNAATLLVDGAWPIVPCDDVIEESASRLKSRSNFSPLEGLDFMAILKTQKVAIVTFSGTHGEFTKIWCTEFWATNKVNKKYNLTLIG